MPCCFIYRSCMDIPIWVFLHWKTWNMFTNLNSYKAVLSWGCPLACIFSVFMHLNHFHVKPHTHQRAKLCFTLILDYFLSIGDVMFFDQWFKSMSLFWELNLNCIWLITAQHAQLFNSIFCYSMLQCLRLTVRHHSVHRLHYVTLKAWQTGPEGTMLVHASLCVYSPLIYSLTIAPPAVSCGLLCWKKSITFPLVFSLCCLFQSSAL